MFLSCKFGCVVIILDFVLKESLPLASKLVILNYAVKFDAEYKNDITFNGIEYKFVNSGKRGHHELAAMILKGRLSFPTVVFLDEELKVIQPIPGYQDPKSMELIITYFARDYYRSTPWKKYTTMYNSNLIHDAGF